MEDLKLPNLHNENVLISNDLAADPWDQLPFDSETKKYLKSNYDLEFILNIFDSWSFQVDPNLTLSQSKIKGLMSVANNEACPLTFHKSLFSKDISIFNESEAMKKGQVFEYLATGQKNYTNDIPDLSVLETSTGKKNAFSSLMDFQVNLWKEFAKKENLSRIRTGHVENVTNGKYSIACTTDLTCKKDGKDYVFDLKLSDPNGRFGLAKWHDSELPKAEMLLIQAKVTKFIFFKNYLKDVPFVFYIASSGKEDAKARDVVFKDFGKMIEETEILVAETYRGIKFLVDNELLKPTPEIKFCEFCKVDSCSVKTKVPSIKKLEV